MRVKGAESASFEKESCDVVSEVAEAERGAAEVLEVPVAGFCRPVRGSESVEEGGHVCGALPERAAELANLDERGRDAGGDRVDHRLHHLVPSILSVAR